MVHSCCMDKSVKHLLFAESERMRATYIRVDVELHGIYGGAREHHRDWSKLRETLAVARQHPRVKVLGILVGTPLDLAEPCDRDRWWCPPSDPARYARPAAEVVRRARGTIDPGNFRTSLASTRESGPSATPRCCGPRIGP